MKNIGSCRFIWSINRILARLSVGAVDYESFVGLRVDMESGVEQDDLTPEQLRQLKRVIEGEYR